MPLVVRTMPAATAGSEGSSNWINHVAPHPSPQLSPVVGDQLPIGGQEITHQSAVRHQAITLAFHGGRQRVRTRELLLGKSGVTTPRRLDSIEVLAEQRARTAHLFDAALNSHPVTVVVAQKSALTAEKQTQRPPDHVGPRAPARAIPVRAAGLATDR